VLCNVRKAWLPNDTLQFNNLAYDHWRYATVQQISNRAVVRERMPGVFHSPEITVFPHKTADNRLAVSSPLTLPSQGLPILKPHQLKFREPVNTDITEFDPHLWRSIFRRLLPHRKQPGYC
jgi:hypothetical protein